MFAVVLKLCRIRGYERLLDAEAVVHHHTSPVDLIAALDTTPPPSIETGKRTLTSDTEIQDAMVVGSKVAWTSGWPTFTAAPQQQTESVDRYVSLGKHEVSTVSGRSGVYLSPVSEHRVNQSILSPETAVCEPMSTERKSPSSFPPTSTIIKGKTGKDDAVGRFYPKLVQPVLLGSSAEVATNAGIRSRQDNGKRIKVQLDRANHETIASESGRQISLPIKSSGTLESGFAYSNDLTQPKFHISTPFFESETQQFTLPFVFGSTIERFNTDTLNARGELDKPSLNYESSHSMPYFPSRPRRNRPPFRSAARAVIPKPYSKLESVPSNNFSQMLFVKPTIPPEDHRSSMNFHSELEVQASKSQESSRVGSLKPPILPEFGTRDATVPGQPLQPCTRLDSIGRICPVSNPTFPSIPEIGNQTTSIDQERALAAESRDLIPFPDTGTRDLIRTPGKETTASTNPPDQEIGDHTPPPGPETHKPTYSPSFEYQCTIPRPRPEMRDQTSSVGISVRVMTPLPDVGKSTRHLGIEIQDSTSPPDQDLRCPVSPEGQDTSDSTPPPGKDIRDQISPPSTETAKRALYFHPVITYLTPPPLGQDTCDQISPQSPETITPTGYTGQDTDDSTPPTDQEICYSTPPPCIVTLTPMTPPRQETCDPAISEDHDIRQLTPHPSKAIRSSNPYPFPKTRDSTPPLGQDVRHSTHHPGLRTSDSTLVPCTETTCQTTTTLSLADEVIAVSSGDQPK